MSNRLDLLLTAFAAGHTGTQVADLAETGRFLTVDDRWVISFIDDTAVGSLRAVSQIGRVAGPATGAPPTREWATQTRTVDGFEWSIACHVESGAVVITASTAHTADAVAFDAWLERFVQRLRSTAGVLSGTPIATDAAPEPHLPTTLPEQPSSWLKA